MHRTFGIRSLLGAICLSAFVPLSFSGCTDNQVGSGIQDNVVANESALLVTIPENDKPPAGAYANQVPLGAIAEFFFSENGRGVAYSIRDYGYSYVVWNGHPGKVYKGDMAEVVLSANGQHIAYGAPIDGSWRMVLDGVEGRAFTKVRTPQFSPDGRHIAYSAARGDGWHLVIDSTPNEETSSKYLQFIFSADSSRIAYIDQVREDYSGRLVISDLKFSEVKTIVPAGAYQIVANAGKTRIAAVVEKDGEQRVIAFSFDKPGETRTWKSYDHIRDLAFAPDGISVAFTADRDGKHFMVLNDRGEAFTDANFPEPPVVRPDLKGVGAIVIGKDNGFHLRQFFLHNDSAEKGYDEAAFLTYSKGSIPAFAARKGNKWMVVAGGKEGPTFDRVVTPRFSPDGKYLVYRARKDGKRFVVVADTSARTLRRHPAYEQVFDVRFTADGKSVAYGVKDGLKLIWKVERL